LDGTSSLDSLGHHHVLVGEPLADSADQVAGAGDHVAEAVLLEGLGGDRPDPALAVLQMLTALELDELLPAHRLPAGRFLGHECQGYATFGRAARFYTPIDGAKKEEQLRPTSQRAPRGPARTAPATTARSAASPRATAALPPTPAARAHLPEPVRDLVDQLSCALDRVAELEEERRRAHAAQRRLIRRARAAMARRVAS
jgi:hypothetical protein